MRQTPAEIRKRIVRNDWILYALAVLGCAFYFWQFPLQHPDSTIRYNIDSEQAVRNARTYLDTRGYSLDALVPTAALKRDTRLLNNLQRSIGRRQVVQLMQSPDAEHVPGYYWEVNWKDTTRTEQNEPYVVHLSQDGDVLAFIKNRPGGRGFVDTKALRVLLEQGRPTENDTVLPGAANTDSLAELRRFIERTDSAMAAGVDSLAQNGQSTGTNRTRNARPFPGRPPRLDSTAYIALAQYHLTGSVYGDQTLQVDSVWSAAGPGISTVRFVSAETLPGHQAEVEVEVSSAGGLLNLKPDLAPVDQAVDTGNPEGTNTALSGGILILLVIIFMISFFKRMSAGTIDTKAALRDAVWMGLFGALGIFQSIFSDFQQEMPEAWQAYAMGALAVVLGGGGLALVVFLISGATDSSAREVWVRKLDTLSLVRQAKLFNKPVGFVLLRGVAVALLLIGIFTLFLTLVPQSRIVFVTSVLLHDDALLPFSAELFSAVWGGFIQMAVVLLGVATFVYRRKPALVLTGGVITVVLGLQLINPDVLETLPLGLLSAALLGGTIAWAFLSYDFLTCLVGFILYEVIWNTSGGWAVPDSPLWMDAVLIWGTLGLLLVIGFIGVFRGKPAQDLPDYVPPYLEEIARQERMERELEIARSVQHSFLPQRMPFVRGLDVAAMCLAAQEVGGDYFDFVKLEEERLAVVIGDVSGKGIKAAFYMTLTKGFIRSLCREFDSPVEVLRRTNRLFRESVPRGTFISMIYGVLDVKTRTFTFARAGHNPIILKRSPSQQPDIVQPTGLGIGLVEGDAFDRSIEETTLHLRLGDVLVFYTDGFSEAMNARKQLYGDERLAHKVGEVGSYSAPEILRMVSEDVHRFVETTEGRHDDMTMIVVKVAESGRPTVSLSEEALVVDVLKDTPSS